MIHNKHLSLFWSYFLQYTILLFILLSGELFVSYTSTRFDLTRPENYQILEYKIMGVFLGCICLSVLYNLLNKLYIVKGVFLLYFVSIIYVSEILPISTINFQSLIIYGLALSLIIAKMIMLDFESSFFSVRVWITSLNFVILIFTLCIFFIQPKFKFLLMQYEHLLSILIIIGLFFAVKRVLFYYQSNRIFCAQNEIDLKFILSNLKLELFSGLIISHFLAGFFLKPDIDYYHAIIFTIYSNLATSVWLCLISTFINILFFFYFLEKDIYKIKFFMIIYVVACHFLSFLNNFNYLKDIMSLTIYVCLFNIYMLDIFVISSKFKSNNRAMAILFYIAACAFGVLVQYNLQKGLFYIVDYILLFSCCGYYFHRIFNIKRLLKMFFSQKKIVAE